MTGAKKTKKKSTTSTPKAKELETNKQLKKNPIFNHLNSVYKAFVDFRTKPRVSPAITTLSSKATPFEVVENPGEALCRWRDTESIPLDFPSVVSKDLEHLPREEKNKTPDPLPSPSGSPSKLKSIKFLDSLHFSYKTDAKKPSTLEGLNIQALISHLVAGNEIKGYKEPAKPKKADGLAMFCGGPISALAMCPKTDDNDNEILAVATFADEVNFFLPNASSSYIQLWAFSSTLNTAAQCLVLLEVPECTVLSLVWCPMLPEYKDEAFTQSTSRSRKSNRQRDECLGLLAAATDKGVVFIYGIPRKLSDLRSGSARDPNIFHASPVATLTHPDPNESVPLASLVWSCEGGGSQLAAVSDAGRVFVWDLDDKPSKFRGRSEEERPAHLEGISLVYTPITIIHDPKWESLPMDVCWFGPNRVVVSLKSHANLIYSVPDGELIVYEASSHITGQHLLHEPSAFDGFFSYDTALQKIDGINYSSVCYYWLKPDGTIQDVRLINRHQLQINDAAVSTRSGIISTAGADGILYQSLNGRTFPRTDTTHRAFQYGRPILHLLRQKHGEVKEEPKNEDEEPMEVDGGEQQDEEEEKENAKQVVNEHADCREQTWLEARCGDSALVYLASLRKHKHLAHEYMVDRRTDALTCVSASLITDGVVATGGEAGLVFILPTLL